MSDSKLPPEVPYVPADADLPELTAKALIVGILMAVVLGAANAYLGMKAGLTISATFPAAVIAIAVFRLPFLRGTVLEQNIARTTASVGEALVAGAIFTIPAFVMVEVGGERLWTSFNYWETSLILLIGGTLGILFVILLRRTLVVDAELPFPESFACYEIVKAGQKGETGAKYVFGALGIGMLIEVLKNSSGVRIIRDTVEHFLEFPRSVVHHFDSSRTPLGELTHTGGMTLVSPAASPALMGVGYIIGPRLAAINFAGGVLAWFVFIPLALFLSPTLGAQLGGGETLPWSELSFTIWYNNVRPIAVGAMLVGALYTLWGLRDSLGRAFRGALSRQSLESAGASGPSRLDRDLDLRWVLFGVVFLIIPITLIYYHFTHNLLGALVAALIMTITGFLFSAVGGWLVGLVGGSNQPISGLTLSALIVAALVMVGIGVTGLPGIGAVLAVAAVVCCASAMAGDMIQDLKVGQLIGGTPRRMEIAEIISTVIVSFVLVFPIMILHEGNLAKGGIGIGDTQLPAPQAGLMAQLAKGIVGGEMPWGLILIGVGLAIGLILIKAPAPMLIAVGMYLPFETTFAIFVGGLIKALADTLAERRLDPVQKGKFENAGILLASGFIAGEALTGVMIAGLVLLGVTSLSQTLFGVESFAFADGPVGALLGVAVFGLVAYALVRIPLRSALRG
ncbi:MAG: oligopeptide transporter, OPT family [Thermoanaerobaculia bacterium]|nr:oligopeptide transporter, OPT family [Thermoanaerobaculia bacterium]